MKKLILLSFAILAGAFAHAAAPAVTVVDGNAYFDGVHVGLAGDAIANNPTLAPAINLALRADVAKTKASAVASESRAVAAEAKLAAILASLKKADAADLPAETIAAVESAKTTDAQKQLAALVAQKAEIEAKIAAIQ